MAAHAAQATRETVSGRRTGTLLAVLASAALAACQTVPNRAPVEDRTVRPAATPAAAQPPAAAASAASSQDHTPSYTVKPGDTLIRISLDTGTRLSDLARWNNIENPDRIEVGQVLRITPPAGETGPATRPAPPSKLEVKPLPPAGAASGGAAVTTTTTTTTTAGPAAPVNAAPVASSSPAASEGELQWAWPAVGPVSAPFDEGKNKGVNIAGKAGDPVYAAADGQVVYAGSGLYGYGNLVIVKHNNTYLTAYAFNRALLVKEDQMVRRGQKIAEMGSTGSTDRVQLHFEIRKLGKPVDPMALLPGR